MSLFSATFRVVRKWVCNEKSWCLVNPVCTDSICWWNHSRGAAGEEGPTDRVSIGVDPATDSTRAEAIRRALRELGHIEGQNIATEYRYAEGKIDRYPELAAELVRLKVDIIVVAGGMVRSGRPRMRPRRFPSL